MILWEKSGRENSLPILLKTIKNSFKNEFSHTKKANLNKKFEVGCSDPVGILTQDLQNRNLTFYTTELRSLLQVQK
jgi:hypothetical protein